MSPSSAALPKTKSKPASSGCRGLAVQCDRRPRRRTAGGRRPRKTGRPAADFVPSPRRAPQPERGHLGRRFLGRQTALGGAGPGRIPHPRASRKSTAGGPRRGPRLRPRRGRSPTGLQETRRPGAAIRRVEHRGQLHARNGRQRARRDGRAREATRRTESRPAQPHGLEAEQVYDETEYINSSVDLVQAEYLSSAVR